MVDLMPPPPVKSGKAKKAGQKLTKAPPVQKKAEPVRTESPELPVTKPKPAVRKTKKSVKASINASTVSLQRVNDSVASEKVALEAETAFKSQETATLTISQMVTEGGSPELLD
jgi:hypothetical protein